MIETIGIFILFLCPLVFVHELGHFIFARLFGVRVEVFSIGFGPKLLKFKKGDTQYALSLIPLGGYVKMFGDDPLTKEEIPEAERGKSFSFKNKWARFWIVFGGPLFNFIFAYFLYFSLFLSGERLPEIKFGIIPKQSNFYALGIRTGDVLKRVNGQEIFSPTDIPMEVDGKTMVRSITVDRLGALKSLSINIGVEDFFKEFADYPPYLRMPYLVDKSGNKFIASLERDNINLKISLDQMSMFSEKNEIYLFRMPHEDIMKSLATSEKGLSNQFEKFYDRELDLKFSTTAELIEGLQKHGLSPLDLRVKSVVGNSPAARGGVQAGDIIWSLGGARVKSFEELRKTLQELQEKSISLKVWRGGSVVEMDITPDVVKEKNETVKKIGVESAVSYMRLNYIHTKSKGLFLSSWLGMTKTWSVLVMTVDGIKKLITNEISVKNIGGPIAIGKVAADSFNTSLSYFFQIMALISVNLGLINLFPIPVLDGGHIMFIGLEIMNRGPLSRRKMEIAQQFGLSLLLLMMFAALFNDFSRYFKIF